MLFVPLLLFSIALSIIWGLFFLFRRRRRRQIVLRDNSSSSGSTGRFLLWPGCWLAIKNCNLIAVRGALGLRNPQPCSWLDELVREADLFVAPPMEGWTLVTGAALPEPWDDVDACYRFVVDLSSKLGVVQFFSASRISLHHAWIKVEYGRVARAYAWAGKTLWNQGPESAAEIELGLKCFDYADAVETSQWAQSDEIRANVERVPLLAARWGFDPRWIDEHSMKEQRGIIGKLSRRAGETHRQRP